MDKPEFVYTTYIRTTPEQLWRGLTDPAFTRRYWGLAYESDSVLPGISEGWPLLLSSLKSLLETGDVLPVG